MANSGATVTSPQTISSGSRSLWRVAAALLVVIPLAAWLWYWAQDTAWDFAIDWLAAKGASTGLSLYDWTEIRRFVGDLPPGYTLTLTQVFESYINPPTTALLISPLANLPFAQALIIYRALSIAALLGSVWLAGYAVAPAARPRVWLAGALGLIVLIPVHTSLRLGQVDGWIVLALAAALVAIRRESWAWAGAAITFAACLKVLPALLLLYLLLAGRWRAAIGAASAFAILVALTVVWGHGGDWYAWVTQVLPLISGGSVTSNNLSLPAVVARWGWPLVSSEPIVVTPIAWESSALGVFRWLALLLMPIGLLLVRRWDARVPQPLAASLIIVVALLCGPLTWAQYAAWCILPLMMLSGADGWRRLSMLRRVEVGVLLVIGAALLNLTNWYIFGSELAFPMLYPFNLVTIGLLLLLCLGLVMLSLSTRLSAGTEPETVGGDSEARLQPVEPLS